MKYEGRRLESVHQWQWEVELPDFVVVGRQKGEPEGGDKSVESLGDRGLSRCRRHLLDAVDNILLEYVGYGVPGCRI